MVISKTFAQMCWDLYLYGLSFSEGYYGLGGELWQLVAPQPWECCVFWVGFFSYKPGERRFTPFWGCKKEMMGMRSA